MRGLDVHLLDTVSADAARRPRLRANFNFHPADDFPAHRLLNAIEPDSYLPPHRHLDANKDETLIVLRGQLGALCFDDQGHVRQHWLLTAGGDCWGIEIPHGVWHTVIALQPGTVIFEAKSGPYCPLLPEEKAPWAPAEGDAEARIYLQQIRRNFL
ncbi:MAG: WbuC family cupin fold metalloprotein [Zoogloeaceae bacterium]|nr:WbuC family cupin fold metalloprotein [Zoogloeaceae bacterium]